MKDIDYQAYRVVVVDDEPDQLQVFRLNFRKDFDLVMMTNRRHGFAYEPYMLRRRWDYFVRHLMGAEPPKEFVFGQQPPIS